MKPAAATKADDIWSAFTLEMLREYSTGPRPLPNESLDLLAQAVLAHNGGAYSAAAIVCRAAEEAAAIQALYLERVGPEQWTAPQIPRHPNGKQIRLNLDTVIEGLEVHGILDPAETKVARVVKEAGDTVAHTVERSQRKFEEYLKKLEKTMKEGGKLEDVQPPATRVSEQESLEVLGATARLIIALNRGAPNRKGPTAYWHPPEPTGAD
jgi:hypothetical protein